MNEIIEKEEIIIENMIYEIRGKQVMFSSDLAKLYHVETKYLNRQVKRNIERFPKDYMFQISIEEYNSSRCQNVTLNKSNNMRGNNIKYLPYVFTEKGIYMLGNILKSDEAIEMSIYIINKFVEMKNYFLSADRIEQKYINNMVFKHDEDIKLLMNSFDKIEQKNKINKLFFKGEFFDSHLVLLEILDEAKEEIIIIDNYASKELLKILKDINKKMIIVSSNIDDLLKDKYERQYKNITFINNKSIHDRFIIIDRNKLYSCGSSFKDLGKKCFAINEIENKKELDRLLEEIFVI